MTAQTLDLPRQHALEAILLRVLRDGLFDDATPHLGLREDVQTLIDAERAVAKTTRTRRLKHLEAALVYLSRAGTALPAGKAAHLAYEALVDAFRMPETVPA